MTKKLVFLALLLGAFAFGQQNTLTQTSLSAAISATQQSFQVASVTGITASSTSSTLLYVDGEAMYVTSVATPTATSVNVVRGQLATAAVAHNSGAMVLAGRPDWFYRSDPSGNCTVALVYASPYVNVSNGRQWLCSGLLTKWVPGFGNPLPAEVTALVASVAGAQTLSGPLFHINGTNAITSFTIPVGFERGGFCVIPDAAFTTTATNNIAKASTAVANKELCWVYDASAALFYPTY